MDYKTILGDKFKEGLTDEEIQALIEQKIRDLNKTASENAGEAKKAKDALKAHLTEEEQKAADIQEKLDKLVALEKEVTIGKITNIGISKGKYDSEDAKALAEVISSGEYDKLGDIMASAYQKMYDGIKKEILESTDNPQGGNGQGLQKLLAEYKARSATDSKNPFSYAEQMKFEAEHPEVLEALKK